MPETVTMSMQDETNPWLAQRARFNLAAQKLNLDEGLWKVLSHPNREITVYIPVQMDDGHLEVFTGYRVQHSIARGPGKGGVRYDMHVSIEEVRGRQHSLRRSQGRRDLRSEKDEPWRA